MLTITPQPRKLAFTLLFLFLRLSAIKNISDVNHLQNNLHPAICASDCSPRRTVRLRRAWSLNRYTTVRPSLQQPAQSSSSRETPVTYCVLRTAGQDQLNLTT